MGPSQTGVPDGVVQILVQSHARHPWPDMLIHAHHDNKDAGGSPECRKSSEVEVGRYTFGTKIALMDCITMSNY
jgi:hypothetical protein